MNSREENLNYYEVTFYCISKQCFNNDVNEIKKKELKDFLKELFQNEKYDESFETHINNLINKYGFEYTMKFKQNAENFINFYLYSKQRVHRNFFE